MMLPNHHFREHGMLIDIAKQGAKAAGLFFWEHCKFALPGILLSIAMSIWAFSSLSGAGSPAAAHTGGSGAILVLLTNPKFLGCMVLLIGFPMAYLIYARKRGVARVVQLVTADKKDAIASYVVERFTSFVEKTKPGMLGNAVQTQQDWLDMFDQFLASKEGLPKVLRKVIQHVARKADIAQAIGVSATQAGGKISTQQLCDTVANKISGKMDELASPPPLLWFAGLLVANVVACFVVRGL
jgi:hypothetical protein